jgi:Na+/proline symporter
LFVLGIVAASFSSADSALTSLTTICCVDLLQKGRDERLRKRVHVLMCVVFVLFILVFKTVNSTSLIDAIYTIVSYTYGPLLGLFAFGLLTKRAVQDRWTPLVAVVSPVLCFLLDKWVGMLTGYRFGYELLMLNGLLTFAGLYILSAGRPSRA